MHTKLFCLNHAYFIHLYGKEQYSYIQFQLYERLTLKLTNKETMCRIGIGYFWRFGQYTSVKLHFLKYKNGPIWSHKMNFLNSSAFTIH